MTAALARRALVLLVLAAWSALTPADVARANGVPTPVELSYIDISNWGPQDATGIAELILAEGIVRVDAEGLTPLTAERYQGWLVNSERGDAISAGRFNADAEGVVAFEGTLPPIADFGFDLFILTVESDPDPLPQPSSQRSIGGYFSLVGERSADGGLSTGVTPDRLPDTGDGTLRGDLLRTAGLFGVIGMSMFIGTRLHRRHA